MLLLSYKYPCLSLLSAMLQTVRYRHGREKEEAGMKKKIFIAAGIILALFGVFATLVVIQVIRDFQQEDLLRKEITEISSCLSPGSTDNSELSAMLDRTVTTDDYRKVEKAIKNYLSDTLDCYSTIDQALASPTVTNALTADTYRTDGPYFLQTLSSLSGLETSLSEALDTLSLMQTDDSVLSYIEEYEGLDSYYTDFYLEIIRDNMPSGSDIDSLSRDITEILDMIAAEQDVLEFLSSHPGEWSVYGNELYFASDALIEEYKNLVLQIS